MKTKHLQVKKTKGFFSRWLGLLLGVGFLGLLGFFLPLSWGVWVPDLGGREVLLAREDHADLQLELVQYWNGKDFYNTELRITDAEGGQEVILLDGDDNKIWGASLLASLRSSVIQIEKRDHQKTLLGRVDLVSNELIENRWEVLSKKTR